MNVLREESKEEEKKARGEKLYRFLLRLITYLAIFVFIIAEIILFYLYLNPEVKSKEERDIIYYSEELKKNPENPEVYLRLAETYIELGNPSRAERLLEKAMEKFRKDPRFPLMIARMRFDKKEYDEALDYALEALSRNNLDAGANAMVARIYKERGQLKLSEVYFLRALNNDPVNADYMVELAEIYEETGNRSLAIEYYEKALSFAPDYEKAAKGFERLKKGNDE